MVAALVILALLAGFDRPCRARAEATPVVTAQPAATNVEMVASGGALFYVDNSASPTGHVVRAVDAGTGIARWTASGEEQGRIGGFTNGALAIDAFPPSPSSSIVVYDESSGARLWSTELGRAASVVGVTSSAFLVAFTIPVQGDWPHAELAALDARTGAARWRSTGDGSALISPEKTTTLVASDLAIVSGAGRKCSLVAIDLLQGHVRWTFPCGAEWSESMILLGNTIALANADTVYAVGLDDGVLRWRASISNDPMTLTGRLLGAGGGMVFISRDLGQSQSVIVALDEATGAERWQFPIEGQPASDFRAWNAAVYANGSLSVTSRGHSSLISGNDPGSWLYSLDAATGKERWRTYVDGKFHAVAVAQGLVIVSSANETDFTMSTLAFVVAYDEATGAQRWAAQPGSIFWGEILVGTDALYAESDAGSTVGAYDLRSGQQRWPIPPAAAVAAVAGPQGRTLLATALILAALIAAGLIVNHRYAVD